MTCPFGKERLPETAVQSRMEPVRGKEIQAEILAHILDDAIHIPGTRLRFGIDPMLGLIPVVGDVLTVVSGSFILLTARQLGVPRQELARMVYYQLLNGVIGAIPVFGDLYSFGFKSHAKSSAVLVSALKTKEGTTCQLTAPSLSLLDVGLVCGMTAPVAVLAGFVGWWFWETRKFSLISVFF
jgi:hypothetical protein